MHRRGTLALLSCAALATAAPARAGDVSVYGLELEVTAERERLLIFADAPLEPQLLPVDDRTLMVALPGAVLDPSAPTQITPVAQGTVTRLLQRLGSSEASARSLARRLLGYSLIPFGFTTVLAAYFIVLSSTISGTPLAYYVVDRDTFAVGQWIAANSGPDDVTLGSMDTGAALASLVPGHVYVGHIGVTVRAGDKKKEVAALYGGEMTADEAGTFVESSRIRYIVEGPEERKLGSWDPGEQLGLQVAAREGATTAYWTGLGRQ